MPSINDGELYLEAPGAAEDRLGAGLAAARAVLDGAGVDFQAAYDASWKPEHIDDSGQGEMSGEEWMLFEIWWKAQEAAFSAIGRGESYETRLMMWGDHMEAEKIISASLASNPKAVITPALDPGPHFTISREALPAA